MDDLNAPEMTPAVDYSDYREKSISEMFEDSALIQLIIMFIQIAMLICKILLTLIWDIVDAIFFALRRIFDGDGELMLLLHYVLPYLYYIKTD